MFDPFQAIATIFASGEAADAAESAADTQAAAAKYATDTTYKMWLQNRADMLPWVSSGANSVQALNYLMGLPSVNLPNYAADLSGGPGTAGTAGTAATAAPGTLWRNPQTGEVISDINKAYASKYPGVESSGIGTGQGYGYNWPTLADFTKMWEPITTIPGAGTGAGTNAAAAGWNGAIPGLQAGMLTRGFTPADFLNNLDPSYKWRQQEGANAIAAAGSATGNMGSGNMGVALQNYGQNLASTEYQNAWNRWLNYGNTLYNRLAGLSGTGQVATGQVAGLGANAAANMGNATMRGADAAASGMINAANARGSGYMGLANQGSSLLSAILSGRIGLGSTNDFSQYTFGNPNDQWGGNIFEGAAQGDMVEAGLPRTVGEEGTEIFVPREDGVVIPNPNTATNPPDKRRRMLEMAINERVGKIKQIDNIMARYGKVDPSFVTQRNRIAASVRMLMNELRRPQNAMAGGQYAA